MHDLDYIKRHLSETDGTGDPDWVSELHKLVAPYPDWKSERVAPSEIDCHCTDHKTAEAYAEDFASLPAVVLVPSQDSELKFEIVDGGHRVLAALKLGVEVPALVPSR